MTMVVVREINTASAGWKLELELMDHLAWSGAPIAPLPPPRPHSVPVPSLLAFPRDPFAVFSSLGGPFPISLSTQLQRHALPRDPLVELGPVIFPLHEVFYFMATRFHRL